MRVKKINPSPDELSPNELSAMRFIQAYLAAGRQAPTIRQIADFAEVSVGAAHGIIKRLMEWNYLARRYNGAYKTSRNLTIIRPIKG